MTTAISGLETFATEMRKLQNIPQSTEAMVLQQILQQLTNLETKVS
jgi:hypothetical protein